LRQWGYAMFLLRGVSRLVLAILTLAAVLVVTAGPATAATGSVQFPGKATRVAHGVALDVPLTVSVTCDEGFELAVVGVFVTQARGTAVVSGSGQSSTFTCTGETQNITVRVFGGVFHGGRALATAVVQQCRFEEGFGLVCTQTDIIINEEIQIRG
jgi:hypothetical protein